MSKELADAMAAMNAWREAANHEHDLKLQIIALTQESFRADLATRTAKKAADKALAALAEYESSIPEPSGVDVLDRMLDLSTMQRVQASINSGDYTSVTLPDLVQSHEVAKFRSITWSNGEPTP